LWGSLAFATTLLASAERCSRPERIQQRIRYCVSTLASSVVAEQVAGRGDGWF